MAKLVFVYHPNGAPLEKIRSFLPPEMVIEFFDPAVTYPADTVFYYDMYGPGHQHIVTHLEQGYRVIFDAKNEHYIQYHMLWVLYSFLQHPGQGCFIISGHEPNPIQQNWCAKYHMDADSHQEKVLYESGQTAG